METILEKTPRSVTVRLSTRRWRKLLELEKVYKLANIIKHSMDQVENEPSMIPNEAIEALRAL